MEDLVYNFPSKPIQELSSIIRHKTKAVSQLIDEITVLLDPLTMILNHLQKSRKRICRCGKVSSVIRY